MITSSVPFAAITKTATGHACHTRTNLIVFHFFLSLFLPVQLVARPNTIIILLKPDECNKSSSLIWLRCPSRVHSFILVACFHPLYCCSKQSCINNRHHSLLCTNSIHLASPHTHTHYYYLLDFFLFSFWCALSVCMRTAERILRSYSSKRWPLVSTMIFYLLIIMPFSFHPSVHSIMRAPSASICCAIRCSHGPMSMQDQIRSFAIFSWNHVTCITLVLMM